LDILSTASNFKENGDLLREVELDDVHFLTGLLDDKLQEGKRLFTPKEKLQFYSNNIYNIIEFLRTYFEYIDNESVQTITNLQNVHLVNSFRDNFRSHLITVNPITNYVRSIENLYCLYDSLVKSMAYHKHPISASEIKKKYRHYNI
jgi:hypothetical protein